MEALEALVEGASGTGILREVQYELSFRSTRAAKRLLDKLRSRLETFANAPGPGPLFTDNASDGNGISSPVPPGLQRGRNPPRPTNTPSRRFTPTEEQVDAIIISFQAIP
nr:hypothetical protein [uncultured Hyphomonas sp.]